MRLNWETPTLRPIFSNVLFMCPESRQTDLPRDVELSNYLPRNKARGPFANRQESRTGVYGAGLTVTVTSALVESAPSSAVARST
jgi:hypothetical protein